MHSVIPRSRYLIGFASALSLSLAPGAIHAVDEIKPPQQYAACVQALDRFIARETTEKRLPALSIALVDDQKIVWAKGFGFSKPNSKTPATADTVYRVGSVSKLFTD